MRRRTGDLARVYTVRNYRQILRGVLVGLFFVALFGPWGFDRIVVPAEFPCTAPFVRLEGDFCGVTLSGVWMLAAITGEILYRFAGVMSGETLLSELWIGFGFLLGMLILVLPLLSTLLLVMRGDRRPWQWFNILTMGLGLALGLLVGLSSFPRLYGELWGIWLYIGMAATALLVEGLDVKTKREHGLG